jgi:hypothetical protein
MFRFFKKKKAKETIKEEVVIQPSDTAIKLNLSKEESLNLLDLRKTTVANICESIPDLQNMRARVALVLDFSGSMENMFEDGTVQAAIERIMPIASQFDDDGELDLWIFSNGFNRLESVNMENFYGIANRIYRKYEMGGTRYSPVMKDVLDKYIKEDPDYLPAYIFFLTDGDNFDKFETELLIKNNCEQPVFWQFIGLGTDDMSFLEALDDMEGRSIDNADFFRLPKPNHITDEDLYDKIFDEYPEWVKTVRQKGIIK